MPQRPPIHIPYRSPPGAAPPPRKHVSDPFYRSKYWRAIREQIMIRDRGRCVWVEDDRLCGRPADVVDHIIPRSQGGTEAPGNLRSLCRLHDNRRHKEKGGLHE
jgi:5-methylcytosine-specific restriction endonuclease McrA